MSKFLDGEAVAQLSQALGQVEESGVEYEAQTESTTEDYQTESDVEETAEASEEAQEDESGHRVPYSRFQKVLHTRNDLRDENDALKAQLESFEGQRQSTPASSYEHDYETHVSEDEEIDKIYQELLNEEQPEYDYEPTSYQGEEAPWKSRVESLEGKLWEFEVDKAQVQLQNEIDTAVGSYPGVPSEFLVQSVIQDPNTNVMDIAERYSAFIAGVEEGAIARYSDQHQLEAPAPPPRPSARSTTAARSHVASGRENRGNPNSVAEAGQAALRWLKDNT
jgi:hypothetical protein